MYFIEDKMISLGLKLCEYFLRYIEPMREDNFRWCLCFMRRVYWNLPYHMLFLEKFLKRFNLNMPDRYVKRRSIVDFERDPPITEIGRLQAKLIGEIDVPCNKYHHDTQCVIAKTHTTHLCLFPQHLVE